MFEILPESTVRSSLAIIMPSVKKLAEQGCEKVWLIWNSGFKLMRNGGDLEDEAADKIMRAAAHPFEVLLIFNPQEVEESEIVKSLHKFGTQILALRTWLHYTYVIDVEIDQYMSTPALLQKWACDRVDWLSM